MKDYFIEIERVPRGYMVTRVIHGSVRIRSLLLPRDFWRCYPRYLQGGSVVWIEGFGGGAA